MFSKCHGTHVLHSFWWTPVDSTMTLRLRAWAFISLLFFSHNINVRSVWLTNVACLISLRARSNSVGLYQLLNMIIFNYALQPFKAYCAIWVRRSNFRHQASPRMSPRESTQRRKVELWARNTPEFCINSEFHVTLRELLHAVKLRHGTDGFTSPPKEGVLRIFHPKNLNLCTKGQHAACRPPKPLA